MVRPQACFLASDNRTSEKRGVIGSHHGESLCSLLVEVNIIMSTLLQFPNRLISSLFLKKPGRSPTRGERSLPCFFVYLIYVESRREASGCILPLTIIIIIIPPPSRRRRYQQPSLPPHRRPSHTSSLAVGPRRAAPLNLRRCHGSYSEKKEGGAEASKGSP